MSTDKAEQMFELFSTCKDSSVWWNEKNVQFISSTILLLQFRGLEFCSIYFGKYHINHTACAPYVYQDEMNDFIIIWSSKLPCGPLCIWTIWAHRGDLGIVNKQTFLNIHPNKTEWQMLCESTVPLVYFEKIMIWCCGWEGCEIYTIYNACL